MVSRVELLAAQSEARANKDEVQAKLGELTRMQAQLNDARYEAAHRRLARFEAKFGQQPYASSADETLLGSPMDRATH